MAATEPEYGLVMGKEHQSRGHPQASLWASRRGAGVVLVAVTFVSTAVALVGWQRWQHMGMPRGVSSSKGTGAIEALYPVPLSPTLMPTLAPPPLVSLVTSIQNSSEDAISWGVGYVAGSHDSIVNIYSVPGFQQVATLTDSRRTGDVVQDWVHSTAFGPGYFASCAENGDLIVYSVPAFSLLQRINQGRACVAVAFGPDFVAAGGEGKVLNIYSLPSFQLLTNFTLGSNIYGIAYTPGTLFVSTTTDGVRLYQVPGFQLMRVLDLTGAGKVAFGPGVFGVEAWMEVHIYSLFPPQKLLKTINGENSSSWLEGFAFGMAHVMVSSLDGKVFIYSLPDFKLVQKIADTKEHTRVVAYQAPYMATSSSDYTLRVYTGVL